MSIRVLPPEVVDQIAAGEVVERPAHLVKELVENSLDAGALRVEVEYAEGGRRVKVSDDGKGMAASELPLALQRFATSKIQAADDLWKLSTFGFRGEALASVASVSRLTLTSRRKQDGSASRLTCEFGRVGPTEEVGGTVGTTVLVQDLFENVPARLKFLKSEGAEHTQIRQTLKALALSRPDVEFRLHEAGQLLAYYPAAKNRRERAQQVLEKSELYEGTAVRDGVRAHAVFASPSDVAKTARQIWLFAQNRWVQDRGMQAAVNEAYRNLLMHGEYPIAAVWVECDPSEIDVNIHPTKSQVKFRDPSLAFRAVQGSLRTRLEEAPWTPTPLAKASPGLQMAPTMDLSGGAGPIAAPSEPLRFQDAHLDQTVFRKKTFDFGEFKDTLAKAEMSTAAIPTTTSVSTASGTPAVVPNRAVAGYWSSLEILGQAQLTYIVAQTERAMVFVDQHAAHERIVFERLMAAWKGGRMEIQDFLFPLAVEMTPDKVEALGRATEDLGKLGVHLEILGPQAVGVKAGPALLKDEVYASALEKTATEIVERGGSFSFEKIVGDVCATMACHSVVRAGQALSHEQMRALLVEMDEFPLSGYCPHGRPVSVELPFYRLEKDFGRIV